MFQEFNGDATRQIVKTGQDNHDCGKEENVYQANGYKNRDEYLSELAEIYGVSEYVVYSIAELLGESEDFDGLVCALEDNSSMFD